MAASEHHNQPGVFSTLVGYEWTLAPAGANLHRNVFFRTSQVPSTVMSALDLHNEEKLWGWLVSLENQGMRVLAIPHNSNASKGRMFPDLSASGSPIDAGYARTRAHFEPLIEMMQVKGNSEVHCAFWGNDEFAGFENADSIQRFAGRSFRKGDFVRAGVIQGLALHKRLGVNPFKLGFAGGTDSHNGTTGNTAEANFMAGSHGAADGTVPRRRTANVEGWLPARPGEAGHRPWRCADGRRPGADGKLPPVGSSVDLRKATYTNSIGAPAPLVPSAPVSGAGARSCEDTKAAMLPPELCWGANGRAIPQGQQGLVASSPGSWRSR